jgi:hypothetical protein
MVIYIDFAALRLWFHNSIQQVEGRDNILIVRFDKQTRILMKRRKLISRHGIIIHCSALEKPRFPALVSEKVFLTI